MVQIKSRIKNLQKRKKRLITGFFVLLFFLAMISLTSLQPTETQYNLQSPVELEQIEENQLGNVIIYTESSIPTLVSEPELEACIYPDKDDAAPTILPVETTEVLFTTSSLETLNIQLSIPRDKLDRDYPQGEVNLTMNEKCPLRSNSEIILTEK